MRFFFWKCKVLKKPQTFSWLQRVFSWSLDDLSTRSANEKRVCVWSAYTFWKMNYTHPFEKKNVYGHHGLFFIPSCALFRSRPRRQRCNQDVLLRFNSFKRFCGFSSMIIFLIISLIWHYFWVSSVQIKKFVQFSNLSCPWEKVVLFHSVFFFLLRVSEMKTVSGSLLPIKMFWQIPNLWKRSIFFWESSVQTKIGSISAAHPGKWCSNLRCISGKWVPKCWLPAWPHGSSGVRSL